MARYIFKAKHLEDAITFLINAGNDVEIVSIGKDPDSIADFEVIIQTYLGHDDIVNIMKIQGAKHCMAKTLVNY